MRKMLKKIDFFNGAGLMVLSIGVISPMIGVVYIIFYIIYLNYPPITAVANKYFLGASIAIGALTTKVISQCKARRETRSRQREKAQLDSERQRIQNYVARLATSIADAKKIGGDVEPERRKYYGNDSFRLTLEAKIPLGDSRQTKVEITIPYDEATFEQDLTLLKKLIGASAERQGIAL